jgi:hypothetical protein
MSPRFTPCPRRSRHVKQFDGACPFCGSANAAAARVGGGLSRSALFAGERPRCQWYLRKVRRGVLARVPGLEQTKVQGFEIANDGMSSTYRDDKLHLGHLARRRVDDVRLLARVVDEELEPEPLVVHSLDEAFSHSIHPFDTKSMK